ncbi:TIGR00730 family Rossman fold protein [Candidatus Avelusimicrobium facis]|uniref:LOG family protein n=1 Tax=Candidatus Avelusimicrobium facis TaxID=3416203 RepID=UPI0015B73100
MKKNAKKQTVASIEHESSYIRAYEDIDLLNRPVMRPVRIELEVLKPELYLQALNITQSVVCFGSARVQPEKEAKAKVAQAKKNLAKNPKSKALQERLSEAEGLLSLSKYYEVGRELAKLVVKKGKNRFAVVTGGGPGLMEAANRGAFENGGKSVGFNVTLPHEQHPNPYISKNLAFLFHYFAIRKLHLVMRSRAFVVLPGGYGTFDELFEILTLIKTGKKEEIPVILVGREFWSSVVNFKALASYGVIDNDEARTCHIVDTAQEAWDIIAKFYKIK